MVQYTLSPSVPASCNCTNKQASTSAHSARHACCALQTNTQLSTGRRKRAIPEGTATPEAIASFTLKGSFPLHKTTQPGILALALHPTEVRGSDFVALLSTCLLYPVEGIERHCAQSPACLSQLDIPTPCRSVQRGHLEMNKYDAI